MNEDILMQSVIGRDFLIYDEHPCNDVFLDYRNHIKREIIYNKKYPLQWYKNELAAIDEILRILNGKKNPRREEGEIKP